MSWVSMQVTSMTITTPMPADGLLRELANTVEELKAQVGHGDHEGWRTEDGIAEIFCGCGELLFGPLTVKPGQQLRRALQRLPGISCEHPAPIDTTALDEVRETAMCSGCGTTWSRNERRGRTW